VDTLSNPSDSSEEMRMTRLALALLLALCLALTQVASVLGHAGGHRGGCEQFGHLNRLIGQDPAAYGFPWARNLGDLVSFFAVADDGAPGVGDIVENVDHAACG
jgi:hypothetical protein